MPVLPMRTPSSVDVPSPQLPSGFWAFTSQRRLDRQCSRVSGSSGGGGTRDAAGAGAGGGDGIKLTGNFVSSGGGAAGLAGPGERSQSTAIRRIAATTPGHAFRIMSYVTPVRCFITMLLFLILSAAQDVDA